MGNQHGKSVDNNDESIRIVMLGKTGAGKSATGNTILGKQCFKSQFSPNSLTKDCEKAVGEVDGQRVAVIDTPSLFDTKNTEEKTDKYIAQSITYVSPGPHIFLIIIKLGVFTEEEKQTVQKIQKIFGEEADKYSMVLFTNGDQLKGKSIEEFLEDSEELKELVAKCNDQYHVFNNEEKDRSRVRKLLGKIKTINEQNGGSYYTTEMFHKAKRAIEQEKQRILKEKEEQNRKELEELRKEIEQSIPKVVNNNDLIRIVMLGKTGVGKSATGNTILGKQCFKSDFIPQSLTTVCEKVFAEVDGQWVGVIDTPGLFDTRNTEEETVKELAQSIAYASPGPHIFLIIIKLGIFTEEEKQTVQKIQKIFVGEAHKYSMVLFTHGDKLKGKPIEEFLKESKDLQELVDKHNGQYHVFNNEVNDRSQVSKLLEKIRKIYEQNEESYYTTVMFKKAERVIEEEKQRILKEREEQNHKELEELRKKIEEMHLQQSAPTVFNNDDLIRIVMVGKTGVGKSATGNTILGKQSFTSESCLKPVTTVCDKAYGQVDEQMVAVIDTPGLFDTRNTEEKTVKDISQSIAYASPGPHIFLIVIRLGRFTEEEKQTVQKIQKIFGEEANKYSMVLFTHGDQLNGKPIEESLKQSKDLQELVEKCNDQYHMFNNEVEDHSQVSELLQKIKEINVQNGGGYYTTEMFKEAEKVIEEKKQIIPKERKEQNCIEQENSELQVREERADRKTEN